MSRAPIGLKGKEHCVQETCIFWLNRGRNHDGAGLYGATSTSRNAFSHKIAQERCDSKLITRDNSL